jgi:hypothetical protein
MKVDKINGRGWVRRSSLNVGAVKVAAWIVSSSDDPVLVIFSAKDSSNTAEASRMALLYARERYEAVDITVEAEPGQMGVKMS